MTQSNQATELVQALGTGQRASLMIPHSDLSRCPQCGIAKPNLTFNGVMYRRNPSARNAGNAWVVYQCTSCENPVSFLTNMMDFDLPRDQAAFIQNNRPSILDMQPQGREDFADWPPKAKRFIEQAVDSLHAPDAAVLMAGSSVDAMLKEKGYVKDSVYRRIEQAVEDHVLTSDMGEWAHSVRLAANSPRHADLEDPHATTEQAQAAIDFVKALGLILFVLPSRIERGKNAAKDTVAAT